MIRLFDIFLSLCGLVLCFPLFVIIYFLCYLDTKSPIFMQERVGKNKKPFIVIKFRTMKIDTLSVASHLASSENITKTGRFLRKTKLDELPQLWNVLRGEMSLVGPRPGLFNQIELIKERSRLNVYDVRPGITGLSQINNIDMSTPQELAISDAKMINEFSMKIYLLLLICTVVGKGQGDGIN